MTAPATPLGTALSYADLGLLVFPCGNGRQPLTKNGFKDASRDPEQIRQWWQRNADALVGIATGLSGLVVIDLDIKRGEDGPGNWARLVEGHDVPATFRVRTPSGGEHLWFRDPDGRYRSSAGTVAPGVDVRAAGGYVIAPSPGSGYTWINEAPL